MANTNIHIGTSGWSYKHWKEIFYPSEIKPVDWLNFYSKSFSITEINTSFYHLPKRQTVLNWREKVEQDFKFCPKLSRYITHTRRLKKAEVPLERFFEIFSPLQKQMGPVLIQLPPSLKFDAETADYFFNALNKNFHEHVFALDVRHISWLEPMALHMLSAHNISFVISQSNKKFPYAEQVTAKHIYLRFHEPNALYASFYDDYSLNNYAKMCNEWIKNGHEIWSFFNNDIHGYAFKNALRFKEMLSGS